MADTTSTLLIRLLTSGDLTALTKGKEQSEALKVSVEGLKAALGALGVGLSLGALAEGSRAMIEYASAINDLSLQAGISTDAFQKLAYIAGDAGLKQEELGAALNVLQRNLAQAADGATKQNEAIADLGLNTSELLAMPVEQQVEAIGRAYTNAADKGKAWAAVIALLGKNSAHLKEVLTEVGTKGIGGENGSIISAENVETLDKAGDALGRMGRELKVFGAQMVIEAIKTKDFVSSLNDMVRAGARSAGINGGPTPDLGAIVMADQNKTPDLGAIIMQAEKAAQIQKQIEATIQGSPQMVAARQALAKAILDESKAYETAADAAKRLRAEAMTDDAQADKLSVNKVDATAQLEAVKLRTEASKLRSQANQQEEKAAKETADLTRQEMEMKMKIAQEATKLLPINKQLNAASEHQFQIEQAMADLDVKSLTYRQDHLKLAGDLLAVSKEISGLKEKDAEAYVQNMSKMHELEDRRAAIALATIEHDINLTDAQKWEEKRNILAAVVASQERYIANMSAIANSETTPQGARDKAGANATAGENALDGTHVSLMAQGANPNSFVGQINEQLSEAIRHADTLAQAIGKGVGGSVTQINNGIKNWLNGTQTFKSAMMGAWQHIWMDFASRAEDAFLSMLENYALSKAQMFAVDTVMAAKGLLLSAASAAKSLIMWLPSAIAASISSYGLAAAIGTAAAIAAIVGMAGGFEEGGYTGGTAGQPAGVVHGEEFVWSAPAVRAIGVGNLERAHQAALSGGGGASVGGGASGRASGNIILAMSPEDVARSQRNHVDARVQRMSGKMPGARYSL